MKISDENVGDNLGLYEGVLTDDGEGGHCLSQGQKTVKLHTSNLDEEVLEHRVGQPVSIVGMLNMSHQDEESSVLSYELGARRIADLRGFNPENNTYVSKVGGSLLEAYDDGVVEFDGEPDELVTDIDNVAY